MNKKLWWIVLVVLLLIVGGYLVFGGKMSGPVLPPPVRATSSTVYVQPGMFDPMNTTYTFDGTPVTLHGGKATSTKAFGVASFGDLNNDGVADATALVARTTGTSTLYYAVVAIHIASGTQGTNAVLLGADIAPQNISIQNGKVVANYVVRPTGPSKTPQPSVGVTKYLSLQGSTLVDTTK